MEWRNFGTYHVHSIFKRKIKLKGDDSRIWQCGVIRVVRNCTESAMFLTSSFVESSNCTLSLAEAISIPDCVVKKGAPRGVGHDRKCKKSAIRPGIRGRDAVRMLTLKVELLRDPVCRESQLAIGLVRTKVQRVGWSCERSPCVRTHSRGKEKIPRTMVSYSEQSRQKWAYEASIWLQSRCQDEKSLTPRIRRTN